MKYGVFYRFCPPLEIKNWAKNNVKINVAPSWILILPPPGKNPADAHEHCVDNDAGVVNPIPAGGGRGGGICPLLVLVSYILDGLFQNLEAP